MNIEESAAEARSWYSSSFCSNSSCVEVCFMDDGVLLRDSKNPRGPRLEFSRSEWHEFLDGIGKGDFAGL
ncbi:hypothetical protein Ait01nite_075370 [Actinoplanes italicus]|uniref:Uncharacterized protein DUF397 n=1 Tax=Actinoplanes italicus TaxID=113567 RepID=A0A2T0JYM4_9ACTN|nr:DUF397 domain-containing protein [Actinoplanes italicus]PRX14629.1 uncharacterized protein DUF397 [Actinoplanes italicus]GIE34492.1 hypothetical protein Ait01nite_075370 [Actinoplanes italicus]